ncbi:MAG: hypothetical protein FWE23_02770 [Chitinivibrionia bacterium]|nr:hypothetical protein [Chitinivibrionia bacterium]
MGKKIKTKVKHEVKVQKIFIKNSFLRGILCCCLAVQGIWTVFVCFGQKMVSNINLTLPRKFRQEGGFLYEA